MNFIRPSELVRAAEDGFIGVVQLVRATAHGIKRDVFIEYTARQMAREAKAVANLTDAQKIERAADMASIVRRAQQLYRRE